MKKENVNPFGNSEKPSSVSASRGEGKSSSKYLKWYLFHPQTDRIPSATNKTGLLYGFEHQQGHVHQRLLV